MARMSQKKMAKAEKDSFALSKSERRVGLASLEISRTILGFEKHSELKALLPSELLEVFADLIKRMSARQTMKRLKIPLKN